MSVNEYEDEYERAHSQLTHLTHVLFMYILMPHKNGVGTLWPGRNSNIFQEGRFFRPVAQEFLITL